MAYLIESVYHNIGTASPKHKAARLIFSEVNLINSSTYLNTAGNAIKEFSTSLNKKATAQLACCEWLFD
ncbi:hypothetical protein HHL21_06400 [Massilia sp. RP-1-19]|uniref:Uncharacterized protein n=1 Tax=Massilia polaris TaxID=2728846 RepID=A0A848HKQ8_9BURK|nr:hypothetical protein [Massilia polaris]NML60719.1 hypothetical protein [Massilia polaris]